MTFREEQSEFSTEKEKVKQTIFMKFDDGKPYMFDYHFKGFFKDACGMLGRIKTTECSKVKAYKKCIDGLVFVSPRKVPLIFDGEISSLQRPLRAQTPQGERIALASSETCPEGTTCQIQITILEDSLEPMIRECLEYAHLRGFGQWRNSGKGRAICKVSA
jgi:hypothetical protein